MLPWLASITAILAVVSAAGESINGSVDQRVNVTLSDNQSTGYRWMIQEIPSELVFLDSTTLSTRCAPGAGCPSRTIFNFYATEAGDGTLKFVYGRSWDKSTWEERDVPVHIE